MRKLLILLVAVTMLASCDSGKYRVKAMLADGSQNGKTAYLTDYDTGDTIATASVTGDSLIFTGIEKNPRVVKIIGAARGTLILESGDIVFDAKEYTITGTDHNVTLSELFKAEGKLEAANDSVQQIASLSDAEKDAFSRDIDRQITALYKEYFNDNKRNPVGYYAFFNYTYEMSSAQLDSVLDKSPSKLREMKRVERWLNNAKQREEHGVGSKMVDFAITTEDGAVMHLSDFVGKGRYVLVDFWASWCPYCIKEIPLIHDLYTTYNEKGLDVVGVTCGRYNADDTFRAIERYDIVWPQILNTGDIATTAYGISGIPCVIIFDPQGTIVSRGKQGEELKADVARLMGAV